MIRATTPIHSFLFDDDPNQYDKILITYSQGNIVVMEKNKEDLTIEQIEGDFSCRRGAWRAWYRLTQDETKKFRGGVGKPVYVQVRVLTEDGEALASEKKQIPLQDVLDDREL
jgi:hypothetical protein